MHEIVFIADTNRNILYINKEGKSLFTLNGNLNTVPFDFIHLFHPGYHKTINDNLLKAVNDSRTETKPIKIELSIAASLPVWLKFNLNYSDKTLPDNYIGVISIPEDFGETGKNIWHQLPGFFQNLPLGIYRTSMNGEVKFVNKGFLNLFGFASEQELYELNISELFVKKAERAELIKKCIELKSFTLEFLAFTKDRNIIWVKDSCSVEYDEFGNELYLDGIIEDITERKLNEQLLVESEAKLKESNLSKDKFFSIISHDLRSPFNQIIGATELILSKIEDYDSQMIKKLVLLLNEEALQSFRLLENLLQWSKNQSGIIQFNPKPISIERLVKDVMGVLEQIAAKKEITVTFKFLSDLHVYADKEMLSTILRNLISNAIKFTGQKGKIIISAIEKMNYKNSQSYLEFCVSDSGIGIAEQELPKLFSLTESYNTKGTYNETGTGLGLLLCKEFVEQHNGSIWVESKSGIGSQFKFTIPY